MEATEATIRVATESYNKVSIETADQLTLIIMLYDGMIRFINRAIEKISSGHVAYEECKKASDIAFHLLSTLKKDDGDLHKKLVSLYFFIYRQIVTEGMEKNARRLEEVLPLVQELKEGWVGIREQRRKGGGEKQFE